MNQSWSCWPTPQQLEIQAASATYTTAHGNAGSLTHWVRPGIKPKSSWILVRFATAEPWWELPCTLMFTAALFTIAKTWTQPKYPLKNEWIKKLSIYTHIYNGILHSHQKGWNNGICSNMYGPRDDHTKWSQTEKDKYHMIPFICGI